MSKQMFSPATLMFLGGIILLTVLSSYSNTKGTEFLTGQNRNPSNSQANSDFVGEPSHVNPVSGAGGASVSGNPPQPATQYVGTNEKYNTVSNIANSQGLPSSCNLQETIDPKELLPSNNSEWGTSNPSSALQNVNLLQAGHHIGIDTVGQSLRNANLQLRSEFPNPQETVGPWNNTTMEPDHMRAKLELGCGS